MSEKQIFNKDYQLAKMAKKRRNRWQTRTYLVEEIDHVMTKLGDANWIMYQVLKNEPQISRKSRVKLCRWLAVNFYDVEKYYPVKEEKPQKTEDKVFSYQKAWQEYKDNNLAEKMKKNLIDASIVQKTIEANQKLYQQLNEANEIIKQVAESWIGIAGKQWCPVFNYLDKYNIQYSESK